MKHSFTKKLAVLLAAACIFGTFGSVPVAAASDDLGDIELYDVEEEDDCSGLTKAKGPKESMEFGSDYDAEAIIGKDTRTKISDTTKFPYSAIAHMYMQYSCGHAGYGTGFMVSDNTMLTAGHCVICDTCKKKISSLTCKFGYNYNGGNEKYLLKVNGCKTYYYDQAYLNGTYSGIQAEDGDYAFVVFSNNVGAITGHYGIKAFSDSDLKGKDFKVGGYRLDSDPLMMATGKVNSGIVYTYNGKKYTYKDSNLLSYQADTVPGNSGGPVFDKNNMIAGIHVAGSAGKFNLARRITKSLMNSLSEKGLIDNAKSVKPVKKASVVSVADNKTITCQVENKGRVSLQMPKTSLAGIQWTSADPSIATVDAIGVVKGKKIGTTVITGTHNGANITVKVTVCYKDVKDSKKFWYTPTYYLSERDVVKGYDNQTKFKPANNYTRAQMVTFLWRLKGSPAPSTTKNKFKDIKKSDYFYKAVLWAAEKNIVAGYKNGTFKPQGKCLRRQMVTFLYKYDKNV